MEVTKMAETDITDMSYPTSESDILAIDNKVDALARQWLVRVQTNFWQFDAAVRTRVTWFNEQHYNPLRVYEGILPHYAALLSDLNNFKQFLDDNGFSKSSSYYQYYEAYALYYASYADVAKPPALVQEDLDRGTIVGICEKVDDGDTLFVGGKEVRLVGINSQEKGTFIGGTAATARLRELAEGKLVTVYFDPYTPLEMYRRVLGAVYLGDGSREALYLRSDWKQLFLNYIMVDECLAEPTDKGRNNFVDSYAFKAAWAKCKIADTPNLARLTIKSNPTHARIFVDGQVISKVTPDWVDMVPGVHHIVIAADGCSAWHEDVNVAYGDNKFFRKLLPLPIAAGVLNIFTNPEDCDVIMNDMPQGIAPLIGVQMMATSPVVITALKEGYESKTVSVLPLAGRYIDIRFDPLQKL
jgi:endonuclease YncB( thermonuclease family)